jgi:hypothetical protein
MKAALRDKNTGLIALMNSTNNMESVPVAQRPRMLRSMEAGWHIGHYRMGAPMIFWRTLAHRLAAEPLTEAELNAAAEAEWDAAAEAVEAAAAAGGGGGAAAAGESNAAGGGPKPKAALGAVRDMTKCFTHGQRIRHEGSCQNTWVGTYDSRRGGIMCDGTLYPSMSAFAEAHYRMDRPQGQAANGWRQCECEVGGAWVSTFSLQPLTPASAMGESNAAGGGPKPKPAPKVEVHEVEEVEEVHEVDAVEQLAAALQAANMRIQALEDKLAAVSSALA